MARHSVQMIRSLHRMQREFAEAPTVRFVREARVIDEAYDRSTEVYPLPGWSLGAWSLAILAALGGLVTGFIVFVLLSTTQLAPDNARFTHGTTAVAAREAPTTSKVLVPEVVEALPGPEPAVVAPAVAPAPRADRDRERPRLRKQRRHASLARAEARVRRAASTP